MYWWSNRKPGSKSWIFGSPPYFYFLFGLYGPRDGRFCLIFACVAHRLLQNNENRPYSSKLYAQSRNLRPDLQPEVVWGAIWTKNWVLGIFLAFSTPVAMGRSVSIFGPWHTLWTRTSCENFNIVCEGHHTFYSAAWLDLEYFHVSEALNNGLMQNSPVRTQ